MGKNKNKKPTESQAKTEKANGGPEESKETKSDIDKILDDWLNGADDDEIPDESDELIAKAKQNDKVVQAESLTTEASTQEKPPESKPASGYKALPMEDANDAWMDDDDIGFTMEDEEDEDLVVVTKKETQNSKGSKSKSTEKTKGVPKDEKKSNKKPVVAESKNASSSKKYRACAPCAPSAAASRPFTMPASAAISGPLRR